MKPAELLFAILAALALAVAAASQPEQPAAPDCVDGNCPLVKTLPVGTHTGVVLDLPPELRQSNWGGGSCVHASTVTLLRWMDLHELAEWWRANYSGGEFDDRLVKRMEAAGLRYAYTHGDEGFLDWCNRTRRGAGIFYKPNHAINFVGMDADYVYLLDNNAVSYPEKHGTYERVPRAEFFRKWHSYGGFAWTLVYNPPPSNPVARMQ